MEPLSKQVECGERWAFYCEHVYRTVNDLLRRGKYAVVVTQPYITDEHVQQQQAMGSMLREKFSNHPNLLHVNLGPLIALKGSTLCYDSMHLTARGNALVADHLVEPLLGILD